MKKGTQRRKDAKGRGEGRREEGNAKVQRRKGAKGIQKKNLTQREGRGRGYIRGEEQGARALRILTVIFSRLHPALDSIP